MIARIEASFRRLRRKFSRSEWLARLLKLPVFTSQATDPGLVLIQIDGLSHMQLQQAIKKGEMPFLRRLSKREHYRLHRHYAGVPSTTSAVQAELFYGIKAAVPGFNFMDRSSGKLVRMIEPDASAKVEDKLGEIGGEPLLKDGSAYVDNYTGGAAEAHFCPTSLGWGPALREAKPVVVLLLIISNSYSFIRMAALFLLEVLLAVVDGIRGFNDGHDLLAELKFIPTRVVISILFRELAAIGAMMDTARGLPVIHLNLLGYDEQSHRRGPTSKFAHWTLKGIDDAIARIWRSAQRSAHRHYDVWIYSDHGQKDVQPYHEAFGHSLAEAIAGVGMAQLKEPVTVQSNGVWGVQLHRAQFLGGKKIQRLLPVISNFQAEQENPQLSLASLGPVAMIYQHVKITEYRRGLVARALVERARIPLILIKHGRDQARAWTEDGEFMLPADAPRILGESHPFLRECARDLINLCHHPDAGDFIACGWRAGSTAYTFAFENGAHGGISPEETTAFALLPADAPLSMKVRKQDFLRPLDLRQAALHLLGRGEARARKVKKQTAFVRQTLKVMTYNIHSCIGMDGKLSPERIVRVISHYKPDIVALQEVEAGRGRTAGMDQARLIAVALEMNYQFHPALEQGSELYGNAILTHLPLRLVKADTLPGLLRRRELEPRAALWVEVEFNGVKVQVINTHLGLNKKEREVQTNSLLGKNWLTHPDCVEPVILCGDFNARPNSQVYRKLSGKLHDVQVSLPRQRPRSTFFGRLPMARIDHIFANPAIQVRNVEVPKSELCRLASDHLPLIAELQLPVKEE